MVETYRPIDDQNYQLDATPSIIQDGSINSLDNLSHTMDSPQPRTLPLPDRPENAHTAAASAFMAAGGIAAHSGGGGGPGQMAQASGLAGREMQMAASPNISMGPRPGPQAGPTPSQSADPGPGASQQWAALRQSLAPPQPAAAAPAGGGPGGMPPGIPNLAARRQQLGPVAPQPAAQQSYN